jgi:hypothetical protein
MFILLTGKPPFTGESVEKIETSILHQGLAFPDKPALSPSVKNLISSAYKVSSGQGSRRQGRYS